MISAAAVHDLHVRIINAAAGELIRELTIDPTRNYQPRGVRPAAHEKREPKMRVRVRTTQDRSGRHHTTDRQHLD